MTIYTPNIVISKNYTFMNNFMEGKYFSDLDSAAADDAVIFNGKQNRYVYSLEHSFNYNNSDTLIVLKIVDVDGNFDNTFFNETFYERLMNNSINKYLKDISKDKSKTKFSDFQLYVNDYLQSQIKIYLAYGIGDSLDTWTDPIACTLVAADVDVANNGLVNYTYKFIPQINNFFRPTPEKDKNDPNRDVDFDFGAASLYTEYTINNVNGKDLNYNISELLKGYIAKTCNVNKDNVVVVIPDLENQVKSASGQLETAPEYKIRAAELKLKENSERLLNPLATNEKTVPIINELDLGNVFEASILYNKVFKSIFGEYYEAREVTQIYKQQIINYNSKQDVYIKLANDLAKSKKILASKEEDKKPLRKKLSDLNIDIQKYTEILTLRDSGISAGSLNISTQKYREHLTSAQKERDDVINKLHAISDSDTYQKNANKNNVAAIGSYVLGGGLQGDLLGSITQPDEYEDVRKTYKSKPDELKLTLRAEALKAQGNDPNKVQVPDWRGAINNVFNGISLIYNQAQSNYIVPHISYETNLRWLKLFKKYNLIADPTQPCVVIGDRQMVLDYIYCNQVPVGNIPDIKSNFNLPSNSPLANLTQSYKQDIIGIVSRKRNSSSFSEKIYYDELALSLQSSSTVKAATREIDRMSKDFDIPIFVNNFKNSNVISYSLKNTENYMAAMKLAVRDNRLKYLLAESNVEFIKQNLKLAGIDDANPIEIAKKLFSDTLASLPQEIKDKKYQKINQQDLDIYEEYRKNGGSQTLQKINDNKYASFIKNKLLDLPPAITTIQPRSALQDPNVKFSPGESYPLVTSNSSENASYLNLALQRTLYDTYGKKINKDDLFAVSQFIILLNAVNDVNGGSTVSFLPGITLPTSKFILSKLLEYQQRYASELTLKTLPFFNLSDSRTLNKPAVFFSKRISTLGNDSSVTLDFFSGEWRIVGFRHVINTQECYSEFMLIKYQSTDETLKGHSL
jgi:hypothetical protein